MKLEFKITFTVVSPNRLSYEVFVPESFSDYTNFLELKFKSEPDEEIYGMGL